MIFHRIKEYICVCVCVCVCVYIYIYIYMYVSKSWHHRLNGQKFEQIAGARKGERNLVCCSSWGQKELDITERLNKKSQSN